jgi:hypothetical protein
VVISLFRWLSYSLQLLPEWVSAKNFTLCNTSLYCVHYHSGYRSEVVIFWTSTILCPLLGGEA